MSKSMTFDEFNELLKLVEKNYGMMSARVDKNHRRVKYMQGNIDFRTGSVFYVKIYGAGGEKEFPTTNEYRNHPKTLKERIMDYINGQDDDYEKTNIRNPAE